MAGIFGLSKIKREVSAIQAAIAGIESAEDDLAKLDHLRDLVRSAAQIAAIGDQLSSHHEQALAIKYGSATR